MSHERRAPAREAILAAHRFPGAYVIKAFGPASEGFRGAVVEHAHAATSAARVTVQERTTPSGHRVCVTLTVHAETVEEVEDVYERLHGVPELMMLL